MAALQGGAFNKMRFNLAPEIIVETESGGA